MRLLGVIRLSNDTDETTSPERQRKEIDGHARRDDVIVGWAEDLDVSGSVSPFKRDQLGPWLAGDKINDWDALIVAKFDRLTRSLFDFIELWRWCDDHGKTIISVQEQFDFGTPQGRAFVQMLAVFAEFERGMIAERVKQAYNVLRQAGQYPGGQVPFGLMPVKLDNKGWGFAPDPEYAPVVEAMAGRYLGGQSLHQVATWLNDEKVPTSRNVVRRRNGKQERPGEWRHTTVREVLESPAIAGLAVADGEPLRDTDGLAVVRAEPIIDHDTRSRLQEKLRANSRRRGPRTNGSPLLRVAFCKHKDCRSVMYMRSATGAGKRYTYYQCSAAMVGKCPERKVPAHVLEDLVERILMEAVGDEPNARKIIIPATDKANEIVQVEMRLADLEDQFVVSGMSAAKYASTVARLEERLGSLRRSSGSQPRTEWQPTGRTFRETWVEMEEDRRNSLLREAGVEAFVCHSTAAKARNMEHVTTTWRGRRWITALGQGLLVDVQLGDLAELREIASQTQVTQSSR